MFESCRVHHQVQQVTGSRKGLPVLFVSHVSSFRVMGILQPPSDISEYRNKTDGA